MVDLGMMIPPELKIREHNGALIEKWILRKAFEKTNYLPDEVLWRYKVQYTSGAGCEDLGEKLANSEMSDDEYERIVAENPKAVTIARKRPTTSRFSGSIIHRIRFLVLLVSGPDLILPRNGRRFRERSMATASTIGRRRK